MKLKSKSLIIFLFLQLLCIFVSAGCADGNDNASGNDNSVNRLRSVYGINTQLLPGFEIACDVKGDTFTGRAPRYFAIVLQEEPAAFLNCFSASRSGGFSSEKNSDLENQIDAHTD